MDYYRLPKNIRQIGGNEDQIKVYLEDYVNSFIHRCLQETKSGKGVLLGRKERINGVDYLFIKGAIATNERLKNNEAMKYFPDLEVCGCFILDGIEEISHLQLMKMFEENYSTEGQVLYYIHGQDEEFYIKSYENEMRKLNGYYIYYERNEEMQKYMEQDFLHKPREETEKKEIRPKVKKQREQSYWKKTRRRESGMIDLVIRTVSLVGIFLLAFVIFSDQISITKIGNKTTDSSVESVESIKVNATVTESISESEEQSNGENIEETQVVSTEEASAESVGSSLVIPLAYTVLKGESIASISLKFYGTLDMVDKICEMNEINNPDYVQAGQKIQLPKRE
jgi:LysM repeat protein